MIDKQFVIEILKNTNGNLLNKDYKRNWNIDNPTYGYCYIVSEAIFHYTNGNYTPQCINFGQGTHWYLKDKDTNEIIDFTDEQFNFHIDYTKGKWCGFMKGSIKTSKGYISKRGYEIAKLLKLI